MLVGHELLDTIRVDVDVLLPAQSANCCADGIGDLALGTVANLNIGGVLLEGEGLTDDGAHVNQFTLVAQVDAIRTGGLNQVCANLANRDDGYP